MTDSFIVFRETNNQFWLANAEQLSALQTSLLRLVQRTDSTRHRGLVSDGEEEGEGGEPGRTQDGELELTGSQEWGRRGASQVEEGGFGGGQEDAVQEPQ